MKRRVDSETNKFISSTVPSFGSGYEASSSPANYVARTSWGDLRSGAANHGAALKTLAGPQEHMLIALPLRRPDGSPSLWL